MRKESERHRQYRIEREIKMQLLLTLISLGASCPEADAASLLPRGTCSVWAERYSSFDSAILLQQRIWEQSQQKTGETRCNRTTTPA